jgi:AcrR family transcriptional regulator
MRDALASEVEATGDLARVTVGSITDRAGLTRRTFYSHYHDIADLVSQTEDDVLRDLRGLVADVASVRLEDLYETIDELEPCPGSVELLEYFKANGHVLTALLGQGGDPAFVEKIKVMVHEVVAGRALDGIDARALGAFFDYYLTFAISAEVGVLLRWLAGGMREGVDVMARIMTLLMFVRPGDLYDNTMDFNIPAYGLAVMQRLINTEEDSDDE